jgi:hypothetical protein
MNTLLGSLTTLFVSSVLPFSAAAKPEVIGTVDYNNSSVVWLMDQEVDEIKSCLQPSNDFGGIYCRVKGKLPKAPDGQPWVPVHVGAAKAGIGRDTSVLMSTKDLSYFLSCVDIYNQNGKIISCRTAKNSELGP